MALLQRTGLYGTYWGDTQDSSHSLTEARMQINASYIRRSLAARGWSVTAIAALLGNMQAESSINPGRWQSNDVGNLNGGYGLVQWTPATKYINWVTGDYSTMDNNLSRITYEVANNIQWIATSAYNMTFREFSTSSRPAGELAKAFMLCYERPADQSTAAQNRRASMAVKWYQIISGESTFVPRLNSDGMQGSRYWYSRTNPFYPDYGLPNCTCYAWGRFWEIGDPTNEGLNVPHLPTGNGGEWWTQVSGYDVGQEPALGAVLCFAASGPDSNGHVAIVEEIRQNGVIVTSNSAWRGSYFYTQVLTPMADGRYRSNQDGTGYYSQGFIYNPYASPFEPVIIGKKRKFKFVLLQGRRRREAHG